MIYHLPDVGKMVYQINRRLHRRKRRIMNQNRFDEEQYKKIERRKSAKKAEYRNKKHKKRRERYGR
jgi:formylmethanofuran dehydrogenase subunit E